MLNDLFGWYKRNLIRLKPYEKKKVREELLAIVALIDTQLEKRGV